jgi:hypothetical protein
MSCLPCAGFGCEPFSSLPSNPSHTLLFSSVCVPCARKIARVSSRAVVLIDILSPPNVSANSRFLCRSRISLRLS